MIFVLDLRIYNSMLILFCSKLLEINLKDSYMYIPLKVLCALVFFMLLAGCAGVQPQVEPGIEAQEEVEEVADPHSGEGRENIAAMLGSEEFEHFYSPGERIEDEATLTKMEQLTGQMVVLQDQLIQLRSLVQQNLDQTQQNAAQLQVLQRQPVMQPSPVVNDTPVMDSSSIDTTLRDIDQALAQLLGAMSIQQPEPQNNNPELFKVASAHTGGPGWIVIRYHVETGETWIAEKNRWRPLFESGLIEPAQYEVQVHRAETDVKGFVAVRINKRNGASWWLSDETWQAL